MDLETENRLAGLLMEEARRLRLQAEKEGVHVYLCHPNVRGRPNSRFLTATVLGVEQANRAVEVNELWRAREKERELDAKLKSREKDKRISREKDKRICRCDENKHCGDSLRRISSSRHEEAASRSSAPFSSSRKPGHEEDCHSSDDGGLRDEELEEFLRSRAKRGRGAVGSRMDEPGPYPSSASLDHGDGKLLVNPDTRVKEEWEHRIILGPEKLPFMEKSHEPLEQARDETKVSVAHCPKKQHHSKGKRRPKEERLERRKSKGKKKSKHHHHRSRRRSRGDSE